MKGGRHVERLEKVEKENRITYEVIFKALYIQCHTYKTPKEEIKMAINSKEKGKRGEREFALLCRRKGFTNARRGQQYSGIEGRDVVGLDGIHIEVKRVERLNISRAIKQATNECDKGEIPIVAHRKNNEDWKITMLAEDWFELYKKWRG